MELAARSMTAHGRRRSRRRIPAPACALARKIDEACRNSSRPSRFCGCPGTRGGQIRRGGRCGSCQSRLSQAGGRAPAAGASYADHCRSGSARYRSMAVRLARSDSSATEYGLRGAIPACPSEGAAGWRSIPCALESAPSSKTIGQRSMKAGVTPNNWSPSGRIGFGLARDDPGQLPDNEARRYAAFDLTRQPAKSSRTRVRGSLTRTPRAPIIAGGRQFDPH